MNNKSLYVKDRTFPVEQRKPPHVTEKVRSIKDCGFYQRVVDKWYEDGVLHQNIYAKLPWRKSSIPIVLNLHVDKMFGSITLEKKSGEIK